MLATNTSRLRWFVPAACLLALMTGCGKPDVGEECDEAGKDGECADDAICTNEDDDKAVCRALCIEQEDCPAGYACNGVSNTNLKSCQPDE
jgi:hypothetical protein